MSCMNLKQYLYIFSLKKSGKPQGSKEFRFWYFEKKVYNKEFSLSYLIHKSLAMQVAASNAS